jgi:hypothetical protein
MGLTVSILGSGAAASVVAASFIGFTYGLFHYDVWNGSFLWRIGGMVSEWFWPWESGRDLREIQPSDRNLLDKKGMIPRPCIPCNVQALWPWGSFLTDPLIDYKAHPIDGHINATVSGAGVINVDGSSNTKIYPAEIAATTRGCTPVKGISPRRSLVNIRDYISLRLTGDKTKLYSVQFDPSKDYNRKLFRSGSPWTRAHSKLDGYYYFTLPIHQGSRDPNNNLFNPNNEFPFLPPPLKNSNMTTLDEKGRAIAWKQAPAKSGGSVVGVFDTIKDKKFRAYDINTHVDGYKKRIDFEYPGTDPKTYAVTHLSFNPEELQYRDLSGASRMKVKAGAIL